MAAGRQVGVFFGAEINQTRRWICCAVVISSHCFKYDGHQVEGWKHFVGSSSIKVELLGVIKLPAGGKKKVF